MEEKEVQLSLCYEFQLAGLSEQATYSRNFIVNDKKMAAQYILK